MKKFKVLYLTFHPHIGGGETILLSLLTKLDRNRFEPVVVVTAKGQLSERLAKLGIKTYIRYLNGYLIRTLFMPGVSPIGIYKLWKLVKKIRPDIIHLNHLNLAIYAGIPGKLLKIPVVATAHGSWNAIYFYQDIVNSLSADKILANTLKVAKALTKRKILNSKKVEVIPFGIDTNLFKPQNKLAAKKQLGISPKNLTIIIVGRLDPVKDHLTFLKAAEIVSKKYPNILFYIVGSTLGDFSKNNNTLKKIQDFLKENASLAKRVVFAGFSQNMPTVYNASDIIVSSSISESFGLTLAEAAACEVPIVTTNFGGQSLIVKKNVTGFLVPPENPELLAEKILTLIKNPKLRQIFGKNGRKYISANFPIENYVRSIEENYLSFVKNKLK